MKHLKLEKVWAIKRPCQGFNRAVVFGMFMALTVSIGARGTPKRLLSSPVRGQVSIVYPDKWPICKGSKVANFLSFIFIL